MADDRYTEGDPRQQHDLADFVAVTAQECQLIADLIQAGRLPEAWERATNRVQRAQALMKTLEKPALPEVDVAATPDTLHRGQWRYKTDYSLTQLRREYGPDGSGGA
jgi:hypothetical protein